MLCLQKNRNKQRRFYKEKTKKIKRVKDIIKLKGCKKSAQMKIMVKNACFE